MSDDKRDLLGAKGRMRHPLPYETYPSDTPLWVTWTITMILVLAPLAFILIAGGKISRECAAMNPPKDVCAKAEP